MFGVTNLLRGLVLVGAVALISVPASAEAGGGFGFCGNFGGGYYGGCFPKNYCYTPCYQPCYRPVVVCQPVVTCQPVVVQPICQPVIQPWMYSAQQPLLQKTMINGARPIVIQAR